MKIETNDQTNTVKVTAESPEDGKILTNLEGIRLLNQLKVPVGSILIVNETKWNHKGCLLRLTENSYT